MRTSLASKRRLQLCYDCFSTDYYLDLYWKAFDYHINFHVTMATGIMKRINASSPNKGTTSWQVRDCTQCDYVLKFIMASKLVTTPFLSSLISPNKGSQWKLQKANCNSSILIVRWKKDMTSSYSAHPHIVLSFCLNKSILHDQQL